MNFDNSLNMNISLKESTSDGAKHDSLNALMPLNIYQNQLTSTDCKESDVKVVNETEITKSDSNEKTVEIVALALAAPNEKPLEVSNICSPNAALEIDGFKSDEVSIVSGFDGQGSENRTDLWTRHSQRESRSRKRYTRSERRSRKRNSRSRSRSTIRRRKEIKKFLKYWKRYLLRKEGRDKSPPDFTGGQKDKSLVRYKKRHVSRSRHRSPVRDSSINRRHSRRESKNRNSSNVRSRLHLKRRKRHSKRKRRRNSLKNYKNRRSSSRSTGSSVSRQRSSPPRSRTRKRSGRSSRQWYGKIEPRLREDRAESSQRVVNGETDSCPNWNSAGVSYWQQPAFPIHPVLPAVQNTAPMPDQMANMQATVFPMYPIMPAIQNTAPMPHHMTNMHTRNTQLKEANQTPVLRACM